MSHKTSSDGHETAHSKWETQQENLMIAIDQLTQITEVMGEVLARVKQQVNQLEEQAYHNKTNIKAKQTRKKTPKTPPPSVKKVTRVH